jgi:hypothetical protein
MKQHMGEVRKIYPELKVIIIRQYYDGDYVISEGFDYLRKPDL